MNELTEREVAIFNAARQLAGHERAAYLDEVCASDAALHRRLDNLLRVDEAAGDFLENPAHADLGVPAGPAGTIQLCVSMSEKPGDRIGPYKLLQQIGEGGCGVVYMADQEEPIRRRVALKVIKLGMDTKQVIARFEAERQALAMMDHPNIAKVLDAGATETGRPYFVMELVHGIKITEFCDQDSLATRQRLDLFVQVCQAIQHAHQKGIIHRDIKPSNILVTINDGVPIPKVIDFGIAKATQGRLTDQTLFTAYGQFMGTPAYMSPEQAVLTGLDVDTRSDIYSLGVLLYELLTGQTPFEAKALLDAGLEEMRRTIREQEPARPSTRLSTMEAGKLTTAAKRRSSGAPQLIHLLRGDLDWIVMKCLEKDRSRRYETANGLAMDLRRHMKDEAIVARPPSKLYQFQKLVRRNMLAFAATGAVATALVLGIIVSSWQAVRATRAEREQSRLRVVAETARANEAELREKAETGEKIYQAKVLYDLRHFDEAERLLDEIPPRLVQPDSVHATLRRGLGGWHSMRDEWREAAADFSVLLRVDIFDEWNTISLDHELYSPVMLETGDTAAYEDFRRMAITRFLQTTNPVIADRICRSSLLLPMDEKDMARLDGLYETIQRGQDDSQPDLNLKNWGRTTLALVDYRRGNYSKAIEWCHKCLDSPQKLTIRACPTLAILAMSCHNLNQEVEARAALARGRNANDRLYLWDGTTYAEMPMLLLNLSDALYGRLLLLEATALIEGRPKEQVQGYVASQYTLGRMYADGLGVNKNAAEAFKWYRKAADQGSVPAQFQLGLMYANGHGVGKDAGEAAKWFNKATERADAAELNRAAWSMAAAADPLLRDGTAAVSLAERSVELTKRNEAACLDALAAAYAETGQFSQAVCVEKEAIALRQNENNARGYAARLQLYESKIPYRSPN